MEKAADSGLFHICPLKCHSGFGTVPHIDCSAVDESVFAEHILHDQIVLVSVYAQMAAAAERPVDAGASDPFYLPTGCDAVDHSVSGIIKPGAVVDLQIVRLDIFPLIIEKCSDDFAVLYADTAFSALDI